MPFSESSSYHGCNTESVGKIRRRYRPERTWGRARREDGGGCGGYARLGRYLGASKPSLVHLMTVAFPEPTLVILHAYTLAHPRT
jgi:hypothetical protein